MRLIDADALEQKKRIGTIGNISGDFVAGFDIDTSPTIDAVPVVRCRECRRFLLYTAEYKEKAENADGDCGMLILGCADNQYAARLADDFCSYGQRKEAEQSDAHAPH